MSYTIADVNKLAERLYVESMRSGERERLSLPVDSAYWDQRAREILESELKSKVNANKLVIEICPKEPRALACLMNGEPVSSDSDVASHLADCNRSGDCEPACLYILNQIGVEFRIVALNAKGEYENRLATPEEKAATCRAIYFDSSSDFSDETIAETYLVWEAASHEE
jgi:hypothetical protein